MLSWMEIVTCDHFGCADLVPRYMMLKSLSIAHKNRQSFL